MITLHDIARESGTSVSTVSRVLSGAGAAKLISPATRQRVSEAAKRLGYRPNLIARSLRTRKSQTIALLVSDISNPFFGLLGSTVEALLHRQGYSLILCNSGEDHDLEAEYLRILPQKGIDGLILVPMLHTKERLEELLRPSVPVVVIDRPVEGMPPPIATDGDALSEILCQKLKQAGVETIGIIQGPMDVATHRRRAEHCAAKFKVVARHEGPARHETGRVGAEKMLAAKPDAVIATNNFLGVGYLDALGLADASATRHTILGCFDVIPLMDLLPVPIVCSNQDVPLLARHAVSAMLRQLKAVVNEGGAAGEGGAGDGTTMDSTGVSGSGLDPILEPDVMPPLVPHLVTNGAFESRLSNR